ncbi:MAG TPA: ABC transporter substrate-binding protein, partial [Syntrophales bacterium]|nr:ABC transporter substrate-binding protein [Syntrophales bacterium]
MKAKNIILALAGLAVAAALVVFILPKKEADIVRIGVFLPMTGGVASYGQMGWAGIKTANELEPTVLGKKVELILVDEKSDKIEAANAVSRLIKKEKVVALIGTSTSGNTMAGAAIAEEARVPVVSPTATDPRVTQNRKYIFRVCFIDPFQG